MRIHRLAVAVMFLLLAGPALAQQVGVSAIRGADGEHHQPEFSSTGSVSAELKDSGGNAFEYANIGAGTSRPVFDSFPHGWSMSFDGGTHTEFRASGHNPAVPATWETIRISSNVMPYLSGADTFTIISTSAEDDPDKGGAVPGTGCHAIVIEGIDGSGDPASETLATNGMALMTSATSYLRVNRWYCTTVGTAGHNVGVMDLKDTTGAVIFLQARATEGSSMAAIWGVPAGKTAIITSWWGSESQNKVTTFGLWIRPSGQSWRLVSIESIQYANFHRRFDIPLVIAAGTAVEVRGQCVGGAGIISAGFEGLYK